VGAWRASKYLFLFSYLQVKLQLKGWVGFWFFLPPLPRATRSGASERLNLVSAKRGREAAERSETVRNLRLAIYGWQLAVSGQVIGKLSVGWLLVVRFWSKPPPVTVGGPDAGRVGA